MNLYEKSQNNYQKFLSLTSLELGEFLNLLIVFEEVWKNYHRQYDLKGEKRKIPKEVVDKRESLPSCAEKLFFILVYKKENPSQTYQGAMFGISQGKVSQWISCLLPLLKKTLAKEQLLPKRMGQELAIFLKVYAECVLFVDVTERPIPRSVDYQRQKIEFSGKKHLHTLKNTIISQSDNRVVYLGDSYEGSYHDKTMLEEAGIPWFEEQNILMDLGYQGYQAGEAQVWLPVKKPKNGQLTEQDKAYNQWLASLRVQVEHDIGGIKRINIVSQKIRIRGDQKRDMVMEIACGLHNLRVKYRYKNKS